MIAPLVTTSPVIALALAGGSFRAASSCGGILRGLHQKTIVDSNGETVPAMYAIKFNSGISGGSIPAILYSYAQIPTEELLETHRSVDPAEITLEDLENMPETSYGYTLTQKDSSYFLRMYDKILQMNPVGMRPLSDNSAILGTINSWWTRFMYEKVCSPMKIPNDKYFTSSKEEMEKIIANTPTLKEEDFLLPRDDVKTMPLILMSVLGIHGDNGRFVDNFRSIQNEAWEEFHNTTAQPLNMAEVGDILDDNEMNTCKKPSMTEILSKKSDKYDGSIPLPYLGTPDEVFTPYEGNVTFRDKMEPVAFPIPKVKPHEWGTKTRFSIETMMAISTNFAGMGALQEGREELAQLAANIRRVKIGNDKDSEKEESLLVADGGGNDLMGILPALQQKVDKIVAIYNFNQSPPFAAFQTTYGEIYKEAPSTSRSDPNFDANFIKWLNCINPRITCYFGYFGQSMITQANLANHVFNDPNLEHLKDLMIKYNSLYEAGEPLVATMEGLETIDNPFWGIKGGKKVDLTLVWFNLPRKFAERVPKDLGFGLDENNLFTNEEMNMVHFPELPNTIMDSIGYTPVQINLMMYLGSWIVDQAWEGLDGHDGKQKFEGFRKIFESTQSPTTSTQ